LLLQGFQHYIAAGDSVALTGPSTQVTAPLAEILQRLSIPLPKKILEVFE
jgi:hypothetical protein